MSWGGRKIVITGGYIGISRRVERLEDLGLVWWRQVLFWIAGRKFQYVCQTILIVFSWWSEVSFHDIKAFVLWAGRRWWLPQSTAQFPGKLQGNMRVRIQSTPQVHYHVSASADSPLHWMSPVTVSSKECPIAKHVPTGHSCNIRGANCRNSWVHIRYYFHQTQWETAPSMFEKKKPRLYIP